MPQNGYAEHHENLKEKTQPKGPSRSPQRSTSKLKPEEAVRVSQDLGCQGNHSRLQVVPESGQTGVSCPHGKEPTHLPPLPLSSTSPHTSDPQTVQ